jgi:cytochrome c oxidase cbb3-type subunit II
MNARDRTLALIFGTSGSAYLALSVMMAVLPGIWLARTLPGQDVVPLSAEQDAGRQVYIAEGCSYCHTQQVRPLSTDAVFGRPAAPGDFTYQTPELLGSERTGPDLTNIGARQSSLVWQFLHLYQPRAVVPQSIMPAFPWLFQVVAAAPAGVAAVPVPPQFAPAHGVVVPGPKARALVAYLLALKQPALPGAALPAPPPAASPAPAPGGAAAAAAGKFDAASGAKLFAANCSVCHGDQGGGVPGAFPPLAQDAVVNDASAVTQIRTVLRGLSGKALPGIPNDAAMPPFADLISDQQIADIIDHERSSWGNHAVLITAADVAAQRAAH